MKGRLYAIGVIGIVMMAAGILLENDYKEALQWMGTGMVVAFVFLITHYFRNPEKE